MEEAGLRLHPAKTRIVYCKDDNRRGSYEHTSFTFLGYQFRARSVRSKRGMLFTAFTPAISPQALKKISRQVRSWRIHTRTRHDLHELADRINPVVRGWMNYYGRFTPPRYIPSSSASTATWCAGPAESTGGSPRSSAPTDGGPTWSPGTAICSRTGNGRARSPGSDEKSGVNREVHAPFRGSPGVQSPRATRLNADKRRRGDGTGALDEDERAELARLRRENAELAMERDVLIGLVGERARGAGDVW